MFTEQLLLQLNSHYHPQRYNLAHEETEAQRIKVAKIKRKNQNVSLSLPDSIACGGCMTSKDSLTHKLCYLRAEGLKDGYAQLHPVK